MSKRKKPESSSEDDLQQSSELEQPEPETVSVEVVEFEELTLDEQQLRLILERKVERAFYECGKALMQLRDGAERPPSVIVGFIAAAIRLLKNTATIGFGLPIAMSIT